MKQLYSMIALFLALALTASSADEEALQSFETVVGSGALLTPPGNLKRIAVVDEEVAGVTLLSATEVLVRGNSPGRTVLFAWTEDGQRYTYNLRIRRDLSGLQDALKDVHKNIRIEEVGDGNSILVKGDVGTAAVAERAAKHIAAYLAAAGMKDVSVLDLLEYDVPAKDAALQAALRQIDSRIRAEVIEPEMTTEKISIVLKGTVKTVQQLLQAVTLAGHFLGETGGVVRSPDESRVSTRRFQGVLSGLGGSGQGGGNTLRALEMPELGTPGLAAQVSRGLIVGSATGRVISFLKVEDIQQVVVSIRVLEIDRGRARSMGINYTVDGTHFSVGRFNQPPSTRFDNVRPVEISNTASPSIAPLTAGNIVGAYVSSSVAILSALELLQEHSVARSVAEPNVLTLTGEEAEVIVGGEVPIPTTAMGNVTTVQSYFFQTYGVRLNIRPTVDENEIVTLEVAPSIARPDSGLAVNGVPGFQVQTVQTTARVKQGESLILGGLLTHQETVRESAVPILGRIPLLGYLFRSKERDRSESELLFVITPTLVTNGTDGITAPVELPDIEPFDDPRWEDFVPPARMDDGRPASWVPVPEEASIEDAPVEIPAETIEVPADQPAKTTSGGSDGVQEDAGDVLTKETPAVDMAAQI